MKPGLLPLGCALLALAAARAEERAFAVTIDGKPAGDLAVSFKPQDDGSVAVSYRADVHAGQPRGYSFSYRGTERWKGGRLVRLEGTGSENSRKGGIHLETGRDAYTLKAAGREVSVRGEVWPNTYTLLPDPDRQSLVVDVLTGDVLRAKIERVGPDRVTVAGKVVPATRYRVTAGGTVGDVWYDARGRLVRRAWTREGRRVVVDLTRLTAD